MDEKSKQYVFVIYNDRCNIPELFSFNISQYENDVAFEANVMFFIVMKNTLNSILKSKRFPVELIIQFDKDVNGAMEKLSEEMRSVGKTDELSHAFTRVLMIKFIICWIRSHTDAEVADTRGAMLSNFFQYEDQMPDEFWWYRACILYKFAPQGFIPQEDDIRKLIVCAQHIQEATLHKMAIFIFIKDGLETMNYYPATYELLERLEYVYPDIAHYFQGMCAQIRHKYVKNLLQNNDYFDYASFPEEEGVTQQEKSFKLKLTDGRSITTTHERTITLSLSRKKLLRFAAHIYPPSPPIPLFNIPWLHEQDQQIFNAFLREKLQESQICNSEGFWKKEYLHEKFSEVIPIIVGVLLRAEFNPYGYVHEQIDQALRKPEFHEKFIARVQEINNLRKSLSLFPPVEALTLFHESMISNAYGVGNSTLYEIRTILFNAIEIAVEAKKINKEKLTDSQKNEKWFNLAKRIVDFLKMHPSQNLLILTGTPIRSTKGEKYSIHALYCVIKYDPSSQQYQIILTNGGMGHTLHECAESSDPNERIERCYAAFQPFKLTEKSQSLQHYIYRLISLQYTKAVVKEDEQQTDEHGNVISGRNPWTFHELFENIYLKKQNDGSSTWYFHGYQLKKIVGFVRQDFQKSFYDQFFDNCTIHNLKYALKILFNMDELQFGQLVDTSLLGYDDFLTEYLKKSNSLNTGKSVPKSPESGSCGDMAIDKMVSAKGLSIFAPSSPCHSYSKEKVEESEEGNEEDFQQAGDDIDLYYEDDISDVSGNGEVPPLPHPQSAPTSPSSSSSSSSLPNSNGSAPSFSSVLSSSSSFGTIPRPSSNSYAFTTLPLSLRPITKEELLSEGKQLILRIYSGNDCQEELDRLDNKTNNELVCHIDQLRQCLKSPSPKS